MRVLSVATGIIDGGNPGVSIADTGKGIDPQDADRMFTVFTTKSSGMGMGLLICRSIVESHDGRLWFLPNQPQGAVFHFTVGQQAAAG
jgi:signal transduction histidine kinase